jgi:hypothetical protein
MATKCQRARIREVVEEVSSWLPNLRMKTFGGPVFFDTVRQVRGYRIQRNVVTGIYRLLDADDYRLCWGTRRNCEDCLRNLLNGSSER